jgi:Ser/Thr protein kinase RdoA (MazF antagonist)
LEGFADYLVICNRNWTLRMQSSFVTTVLTEFGVLTPESLTQLESQSAAEVYTARTASGQPAYLKLTSSARGLDAVAAARRELHFYQEIAPSAPVRTPKLLDAVDTNDGVAVLLETAGDPLPARSWTTAMWVALGKDLAALHSMQGPALQRPDALQLAMANPDMAAIESFWGPALPMLAELLTRCAELEQSMDSLPSVFGHGDCHTGNILHAGGSLVFLDWQVSGLGRPGSDLAFLNVRAASTCVTAPPDLLDAYLSGIPTDRRALELALVAEELAVFVFQWPPFAAFNWPMGNEHVRQRARVLCSRWEALT